MQHNLLIMCNDISVEAEGFARDFLGHAVWWFGMCVDLVSMPLKSWGRS